MRQVLAQLDGSDDEHPCVSLIHESEWSLGAYANGVLVWENLEEGEPRHLKGVTRDKVLDLWLKLSEEGIAAIEKEPWLPGYSNSC